MSIAIYRNQLKVNSFWIRFGASLTILTFVSTPKLFASNFDAICGTIRCSIVLSKNEIKTPYGIIPTSRVSSWGGGGKSETDLIMGAGATYLLGPIGLIGFAAKTHDYNYALNGYDTKGNKIVVRIQFKNSKPAKKFALEMIEFTRLGMNESRTASEIKRIESLMSKQGLKWVGDLPLGTLDTDYENEHTRGSNPIAQEKCWAKNLESNPQLKAWAKDNPDLALNAKKKYKDCQQD